jgi:hypothetical protein
MTDGQRPLLRLVHCKETRSSCGNEEEKGSESEGDERVFERGGEWREGKGVSKVENFEHKTANDIHAD